MLGFSLNFYTIFLRYFTLKIRNKETDILKSTKWYELLKLFILDYNLQIRNISKINTVKMDFEKNYFWPWKVLEFFFEESKDILKLLWKNSGKWNWLFENLDCSKPHLEKKWYMMLGIDGWIKEGAKRKKISGWCTTIVLGRYKGGKGSLRGRSQNMYKGNCKLEALAQTNFNSNRRVNASPTPMYCQLSVLRSDMTPRLNVLMQEPSAVHLIPMVYV